MKETVMKRIPLVSVIIPVYNTGRYLKKCIRSLIAQTYRELEIIIVDDGSTDGSGSLCDKFAAKDPRITVFHQSNAGSSAARNYALDRIHGDYIAFLDSDDWLEQNAVEIMINSALEHDADMVVFRFYEEWENKRQESYCMPHTGTMDRTEFIRAFVTEPSITNSPANKLFRKELFSDIRYPVGRKYEDIATIYKLVLKIEKAALLNNVLYHYRKRGSSISNKKSVSNTSECWEAHYERGKALSGLSPDCDKKITDFCLSTVGKMLLCYGGSSRRERNDPKVTLAIDQMQDYVRKHFHEVMHGNRFTVRKKLICLCFIIRNPLILKLVYIANHICQMTQYKKYYK